MESQTKGKFFSEDYDNDFRSIKSEIVTEGIFNRFWRMRPMVGAEYEKQPTKILLVLESYYFDKKDLDNESVFNNADDWYKTEGANLIPKDSERHVNMHEDWICNPTKGPYPNIYRSLCAVRDGNFESQCRSVAIYNYFLRPAFNNNGSKGFGDKYYCKEIDRKVAFEAFCGIINTLKPNIVVFLTKFSFNTFQKHSKSFENIQIEYAPHPSSKYWNVNKYFLKNYNDAFKGKEKFERFISDSLEKRHDQKPVINEIIEQICKITNNEEWWSWGGWLLVVKLKNRIGIEACFERVDKNPFGKFKIFIVTWKKEDYQPYSALLNEQYPDKSSTIQGEKVVLEVDDIQENNKDLIIAKLKMHYENLIRIVAETS